MAEISVSGFGDRPVSPARWLWIAGAAAAGLALLSSPVRATFADALASLDPRAVLAAATGQLATLALCAAALCALSPRSGFGVCLASRLLRDGGGNLAGAPGVGEIAGARILVLAGRAPAAATSATVLDILAESLAQVPFAACALIVLAGHWRPPGEPAVWIAGLALAGALGAIVLAAGRERLLPSLRRALARLGTLLAVNRRALALATVLHGAAWAMNGAQVWCVARALGHPLTLPHAILLEGFVYAARGVAFGVPAGLGVQEAAFVAGGLAFGLQPADALAIALAFRARDLLFGGPALLAWPLIELRRGRWARRSSN